MAMLDMLNKPMFASRFKIRGFLATYVFAAAVLGLSIPNFFLKDTARNARFWFALIVSGASIIITTYLIAMEHAQPLRHLRNPKVCVVIGFIETALWGVVGMLIMQANIKKCDGGGCVRSWIIAVVALLANHSSLYSTAITLREIRENRK